jgi:hypothetical protein
VLSLLAVAAIVLVLVPLSLRDRGDETQHAARMPPASASPVLTAGRAWSAAATCRCSSKSMRGWSHRRRSRACRR